MEADIALLFTVTSVSFTSINLLVCMCECVCVGGGRMLISIPHPNSHSGMFHAMYWSIRVIARLCVHVV